MNDEQLKRFHNVLSSASYAARDAVNTFGADAQRDMAIEECGELITALAQRQRARVSERDVMLEAADVVITALGLGYALQPNNGPDALLEAISLKTQRLRTRLRGEAK